MTAEASGPEYASFTRRLIACTIDLCLLTVMTLPVTMWLSAHVFNPINVDSMAAAVSAPGTSVNGALMAQMGKAAEGILIKNLPQIVIMNLLQLVLIALYILIFWFRYSATPGKMILRMEIRGAISGERMTRKQAVKRFLGYFVSALPFTLGFLWMLLNKKKQGWHDLIAGTVVVRRKKNVLAQLINL